MTRFAILNEVILPIKKIVVSFGYGLFAVAMAWLILFVSLSRLSLSVLAKEGGCDSAKQQLIAYTVVTSTDSNKDEVYTLPNVSMLPSNIFYGFKSIRDYFWLLFSVDNLAKSKITLFIGDKNMAEMYELIEIQQPNHALESAIRGKNRLIETGNLLEQVTNNIEEKTKVENDLTKAGKAYRQMVESLKPLFDLDQSKYSELIKDLDDWNQKQEEKIKEKSY